MRDVLPRAAALVAAGAIGAADARAAFDATVSGAYYAGYGLVSEDDDDGKSGDGRQSQALNEDFEVEFRIFQVLDNGLELAGKVELSGATATGAGGSVGFAQLDGRQLSVHGGFGELTIGDEDDARRLTSFSAPDPTNFIFGVSSPTFTFNSIARGQVATSNAANPALENNAAKIIYFLPSRGGVQLALSYAPDGARNRAAFGTGGTNEAQVSNAVSIGAGYFRQLHGVTIGAGGGYSRGAAETDGADPRIWGLGVNLGHAGVTVGGSIAVTDFDTGRDDKNTVFDVGATYGEDRVTVGLGWSHGEYADVFGRNDDALDHIQIGLRYTLGEGVDLAAFIGWFDYDDGGPLDNDNTGWQTGIGTGIAF